jgi:hypothetical protein
VMCSGRAYANARAARLTFDRKLTLVHFGHF